MLSLLRLERKQKNYSNPFRIRIFLFLSYSFGIETINTFILSCSSPKTIPDSRPKWAKFIPVFRQKRRKNPTRWGVTYLYSFYKGVLPGIWIRPRSFKHKQYRGRIVIQCLLSCITHLHICNKSPFQGQNWNPRPQADSEICIALLEL